MANILTLAVAGSGKTRGIVKCCAEMEDDKRVLVITYTQSNQAELRQRLSRWAGDKHHCQVMGWFTFLLRDFARPFIRFKFSDCRVQGFNFKDRPNMYAKGKQRFLDRNGAVYACELGRLARELIDESSGALVRRLECIYDEMFIDEVQDLSAHDFEILDVLLKSSIAIHMVGDIRQAVLSTNPRSTKNKRFSYANAIEWFRDREQKGLLSIRHECVTWRCRPEIAALADSIFDSMEGFPKSESRNSTRTGHDGVFLVKESDVCSYVEKFRPMCLRYNISCGKQFPLEYRNFGEAKGAESDRVLIVPTDPIARFLTKGTPLEQKSASGFYVAVTRARQSLAIVLDGPTLSATPCWNPAL